MKAAFTRAYNKESHKTPYALRAVPKKGRRGGTGEDNQTMDEEGVEQQDEENEDNDDDIENNAMIKATKKPAKAAANAKGKGAKGKDDAAKGKGKGRGKNRK